jgi:AmmeMemoRadiSam system protein B
MIKQGTLIVILFIVLGGVFVLQKYSNPDNNNFHQSYFGSKDIFEKSFANLPQDPKPAGQVFGIIVNHHLLAADLIARIFSAVDFLEPSTVVLISPDHFYAGKAPITTSAYNWQTPYGILETDIKLVKKLGVNIEEKPFEKEHGTSGIIPYIKRTFPNSKVMVLIVKDNAPHSLVQNLSESLLKNLPKNSFLVGSFDFSHTFDLATTEANDARSLDILANYKLDEVSGMAVDSRAGIYLILEYMKSKGAKFNLIANTNAALVLNNPALEDVTSYIVGYFSR